MGFVVNGVEYDSNGKIKAFPNYYLNTDDKTEAFTESMRRGTAQATFTPVASRPACYDPVTGQLVITSSLKFRIWMDSVRPLLRLICFILIFLGATVAFIYFAVAFLGVDTRSPFERRQQEQKMRDINRGQ